MKNFVLTYCLLFCNILHAQEINSFSPISKFEYGFYGGISSEAFTEIGSVFFLEVKANMISNLKIKTSLGYSKLISPQDYNVTTYSTIKVDNTLFYHAIKYNVNKKIYELIPLGLGIQYFLNMQKIFPYIIFSYNYNYINTKIEEQARQVQTFNSFEEMPEEYKKEYTEVFPDNSFSMDIGIGISFQISMKSNLDIRYFYKIDNTIVNTHQIVIGFFF